MTFSLFFRAPCPFNLTCLSFLHHLFLPAEVHNFPSDSLTADCGTKTRLFAKHTLTYTNLHVHLDVHSSCQVDHLSESFLSKGYMLWTLLNPCSSIFVCNLNDQTAQREDAYLMLWCRDHKTEINMSHPFYKLKYSALNTKEQTVKKPNVQQSPFSTRY